MNDTLVWSGLALTVAAALAVMARLWVSARRSYRRENEKRVSDYLSGLYWNGLHAVRRWRKHYPTPYADSKLDARPAHAVAEDLHRYERENPDSPAVKSSVVRVLTFWTVERRAGDGGGTPELVIRLDRWTVPGVMIDFLDAVRLAITHKGALDFAPTLREQSQRWGVPFDAEATLHVVLQAFKHRDTTTDISD